MPYNFYPRPPRGGRHGDVTAKIAGGDFYPRPPRGGRLGSAHAESGTETISIHALREEGDLSSVGRFPDAVFISIHALREEGDASVTRGDSPN